MDVFTKVTVEEFVPIVMEHSEFVLMISRGFRSNMIGQEHDYKQDEYIEKLINRLDTEGQSTLDYEFVMPIVKKQYKYIKGVRNFFIQFFTAGHGFQMEDLGNGVLKFTDSDMHPGYILTFTLKDAPTDEIRLHIDSIKEYVKKED